MTRIHRTLLVLTLTCGLAACSLPERGCASPQVFCVGLVTNTAGLQDHGLTQSAWQGLQRAAQERLVQQLEVIESVDARDYAKNLATFAGQDYDLVIASGEGLSDETREQARLHPQVHFLGLAQEPPEQAIPNLSIMSFSEEQGGFLAGALAAQVSQTGILGAVCETSELDSMWRYCQGFRAGAEHQNEQIQVLIAYHEPSSPEDLFNDQSWAAQMAEDMIARGVDVIFGVGGELGQEALRRSTRAGIWSIGAERDQFFVTREARLRLLTSAIPQADQAVYQFLQDLKQGQATGQRNGSMGLAPYHDGAIFIPLSLQAAMLELEAALENGQIPINIEGIRQPKDEN